MAHSNLKCPMKCYLMHQQEQCLFSHLDILWHSEPEFSIPTTEGREGSEARGSHGRDRVTPAVLTESTPSELDEVPWQVRGPPEAQAEGCFFKE